MDNLVWLLDNENPTLQNLKLIFYNWKLKINNKNWQNYLENLHRAMKKDDGQRKTYTVKLKTDSRWWKIYNGQSY